MQRVAIFVVERKHLQDGAGHEHRGAPEPAPPKRVLSPPASRREHPDRWSAASDEGMEVVERRRGWERGNCRAPPTDAELRDLACSKRERRAPDCLPRLETSGVARDTPLDIHPIPLELHDVCGMAREQERLGPHATPAARPGIPQDRMPVPRALIEALPGPAWRVGLGSLPGTRRRGIGIAGEHLDGSECVEVSTASRPESGERPKKRRWATDEDPFIVGDGARDRHGHGEESTDTADMPQGEQLEQLVLAGLALTSEASLEGVLQRVVAIAAEVIGARYTAIGVLAPDGRLLERFITHGISEEERTAMGPPPSGHGILGLILREGRPIRLPDLARHPDSCGFPPHHPPMHSFLGVPITGRRGVIGNLYLTEKLGGGVFTSTDEHVTILLAAMAAAAVENARLHEESAHLLAEVHQLHRARERFFAMVNHELRNALAAVYGWSELLVRKQDRATAPRAAFEVFDAAQQAVDLISDLLDLSRLDEDRLRTVMRPVDPGALAHRAVARVTPVAAAKAIRIDTDFADAVPTIITDASRVEQILTNLLSNAVKYSPAGTRVRVAVRAEGALLRHLVTDEGPGIREEEAERIFDVYVTTAEGEKQGVGLGLPLSRRLARLLGGDLRALPSDGVGIFQLDLPIPGGNP